MEDCVCMKLLHVVVLKFCLVLCSFPDIVMVISFEISVVPHCSESPIDQSLCKYFRFFFKIFLCDTYLF